MKRTAFTFLNLSTLHLMTSSFEVYSIMDLSGYREELSQLEILDPDFDETELLTALFLAKSRPKLKETWELLRN